MKNPITPSIIALKREVTESIYTGFFSVRVNNWVEDPETGIRRKNLETICEGVPCRVVAQHMETDRDKPSEVYKMVGIDLKPEVYIPPGSIIHVWYNGREDDYHLSSEPQVYTSHQRINARLIDVEKLEYA